MRTVGSAAIDQPPRLEGRPAYPDGYADVVADLDALFRGTPMHTALGIDVESCGPGWV